jgi:quercetin 2,3-dioxygenase
MPLAGRRRATYGDFMITIRKSEDRGHVNRGWLDAYFTFSFADYYDPAHMGYRALRVINDDRIAPGKGFGPHAHRDMEIITYVLQGRLLHRDSTGEQHVIGPNEIQTMSAGDGIVHSEFNASDEEPVHSIQIWIEPAEEDLKPSYQQISFDPEEKRGKFRLLAAPKMEPGRITTINQDARLYVAELRSMEVAKQSLAAQRHAWVQVLRGKVSLNGSPLTEGDGAAVSGEQEVHVTGDAPEGGEVLLFDLQ